MVKFEKKKWKEKLTIKINGLLFYIKIKRDESGDINQIMEKPNFKQIPPGHYVGEHIIVHNPIENHYDHSSGAITWKEYPLNPTLTLPKRAPR